MEYEYRRIKWYWVLLFGIYSAVVVYAILSWNPYLYSHKEFQRELLATPQGTVEAVPSKSAQLPIAEGLGEQSYFARLNGQRTADGPSDLTLGKNFIEKDVLPLAIADGFHVSAWAMDSTGVYLGGTGAALGYDLAGNKIWEFRLAENDDKPLLDVIADQGLVYLIHPSGKIVALNKKTGQLHWLLRLNEDVVGTGMVAKGKLLVPLKAHGIDAKVPRPAFRWAVINRDAGDVQSYSKPIDAKPEFSFSNAPELGSWILSYDNKVIAVDPDKLEVQWSQTLTDPIRGPVVAVGHDLYVSTLAGKILKLDGSKKGRQEWEAELQRPPVTAPTYLPVMNKLAVLDDQNALEVIDGKLGKSLWRMNVENGGSLKDPWALRMKGSVIQEMTMDWSHKGWSLWTACSKNRICFFNPAKGQLINRISVSGSLLSLPVIKDKDLYFLIDQGKNWAVSHLEVEQKHHDGIAPAAAAAATPKPPESH